MIINQISVFLENKPGTLLEVIQQFAANNIDLQAMSVAETTDYGVLRAIVDKPEETVKILSEGGWICSLTPVLAISVPDRPGALRKILSTIGEHGINLAYSYAFLSKIHGKASIVLRVDDNDEAARILEEAGVIE